MSRYLPLPHAGTPTLQLLGDANHALQVSSDGSRALLWQGKAVNRWASGRMPAGTDVLLRDLDHGGFISTSGQRYGGDAVHGETLFGPGRVCFSRRARQLETTLTFAIDPRHGGEISVLDIHNPGDEARHLEVVSTMELVLGDARADASHPAYSKMFVVTEAIDQGQALLAHRRPRADGEPITWAAQGCRIEGAQVTAAGFETDRAALLGRGRTLRNPALFDADAIPDGSAGIVLDPVFCLRRRFTLKAGGRVRLAFHTLAGGERKAVLDGLHAALDSDIDTTLAAAAAQAAKAWQADGLDESFCDAACTLASALRHADNRWRANAATRLRGRGGQPALWPYAISGDRPIVQLRIGDEQQVALLQQLLKAQRLWLAHQLAADLVVIHPGQLGDQVHKLVAAEGPAKDAGGAVFVLDDATLDAHARDVIATAAAARLDAAGGDLLAQVAQLGNPVACTLPPVPARIVDPASIAPARPTDLLADNGLGGFVDAGREYVIDLGAGRDTPTPWVNVIANPRFGCIVSSGGGGYAWAINSQQNQITPWRNDPVTDAPGDAIYLRDADSGALWCPTPAPIRDGLACRVAHGQGYTRFERHAHGIDSELTVFVAGDDPVRISRLRLTNRSQATRRIDVTACAEWALESIGHDARAHTACWRDDATGAVFARNIWRGNFADRTAFLDLDQAGSFTCDRNDFLGPRRDPDAPAALAAAPRLGARQGIGVEPFAALARRVELGPGTSTELVVLLGQSDNEGAARALVQHYRSTDIGAVLDAARARWDAVAEAVQVATPDAAVDVLLNRWLPYQVLSCRVWARTANYQASGAWGFRDQLQDVMALCLSRPDMAREHILRSASRQFAEGDVQHWWLPPDGAGVRTRIVDDRVWLPYVTAHYVRVTGDTAILDESIAFLDAPALKEDQVDSFTTPAAGKQTGSLFEHCARALEVSFGIGAHGLPLFGRGDWNDGMNHVGKDGKGESVWMAWFLIAALRDFLPLAAARGETQRVERWRKHASSLAQAAEAHAWDGDWWTRGWYDNGHPLGVAASDECRIDSIAQSWSVLSEGADRCRASQAMAAVDKLAVRRDAEVIALFTPAFDRSPEDPGYIKGYPPGLRENGGQYTHGVIWSAIAFAELGDGDKAGELLSMLNPVHHGDSADKIARYKVEPYVSCADVYTAQGHLGRGGWTWYSGSAGWLYRAILEWQLGLRVEGDSLRIQPCIPSQWPGYAITLRHGRASYVIRIDNPRRVSGGVIAVSVDGQIQQAAHAVIPLHDDAKRHEVNVELG